MATSTLQRLTDSGARVSAENATRWRRVRRIARRLWRGVRDWCGDSAYERYLTATKGRTSPSCPPLSQEQFYVEQLNRRYSRPNRCC
jgi:uncharacterized short protein YbdD (DUF466 family)